MTRDEMNQRISTLAKRSLPGTDLQGRHPVLVLDSYPKAGKDHDALLLAGIRTVIRLGGRYSPKR